MMTIIHIILLLSSFSIVNLTRSQQAEISINNEEIPKISCPGSDATIIAVPGQPGIPGIPGIPGQIGPKGDPGSCSQQCKVSQPNIKQCAWNKLNSAISTGPIHFCTFNKKFRSSMVRASWYGTTRVKCSYGSPCCQRWYFTFNGAECSNPQTIEGLMYVDDHNSTVNIHRSTAIVGICNGLNTGIMNIEFLTGRCDGEYYTGDVRTAWNSVSRIIIEEIGTD